MQRNPVLSFCRRVLIISLSREFQNSVSALWQSYTYTFVAHVLRESERERERERERETETETERQRQRERENVLITRSVNRNGQIGTKC